MPRFEFLQKPYRADGLLCVVDNLGALEIVDAADHSTNAV